MGNAALSTISWFYFSVIILRNYFVGIPPGTVPGVRRNRMKTDAPRNYDNRSIEAVILTASSMGITIQAAA